MSLDVHLTVVECEHCGSGTEVFWQNYTHNVAEMAEAAGVYGVVWRPDENGVTCAAELIEPLKRGIEVLKADAGRYRAMNPENGWGSYDTFVPWLERYLDACEENPSAKVRADR